MATEVVTMMPVTVFLLLVIFSFLSIAYAWIRTDYENYTDIIACILSVVLLGVSAYALYGGITYTAGVDIIIYRSNAVAYLLTFLSVIMGLFTFVKITDRIQDETGGWMRK
jgi:predicted ferric reductase